MCETQLEKDMSAFRGKVGRRIKAIRIEQQQSQEKIARESGFGRDGLSAIENGRSKMSIDRIFRIARALKVNPARLLDVQGE